MRSRSLKLLAAVSILAAGIVFAVPTAVSAPSDATKTYIVQMVQSPAVAYTGGVNGLKATKPAKGQKINPASPDVAKYVDYLKAYARGRAAKVNGGQKLYDYTYTYNGFSAELTECAGREARSGQGCRCGHGGRAPDDGHVVHADVPGPHRPGWPVVPARRPG